MIKESIKNRKELQLRILELKNLRIKQEMELKHSIKEFASTLSPVAMIKHSLHELVQDKDVKLDLANLSLNAGANFIIDKILGKNRSVKGYLSSLLMENISKFFINKNAPEIISGISKLITSKSKPL